MSYNIPDESLSSAHRQVAIREVIPKGFRELNNEDLEKLGQTPALLKDLVFYCYDIESGVEFGTWEYVSYFQETRDPRYPASFNAGTIFAVPAEEGAALPQPAPIPEPAVAPRDPMEGLTEEQKAAAHADFLSIAGRWATAKQALDKVKAEEDSLRLQLDRAWIYTGNKGELPMGYEISREYPITTEMDGPAFLAIKPRLVKAGWNPETLVRTKYELEKKAYNQLPLEVRKIVDECLSYKTGKVQIKVKAPAEPKAKKGKK